MKRFALFRNGKAIGDYSSERVARFRFLKVCSASDFKEDVIQLLDLEDDAKVIAEY